MKHLSILELFHRSVDRYSSHVAIESAGTQIRYRELEERANRLANYLSDSGAPKGAIIPILSDDAITATVSILAILKMGGVFVPLDPRLPERRLSAMISQLSPQWFIVDSKYQKVLSTVAGASAPGSMIISFAGESDPSERSPGLNYLDAYDRYQNAHRRTTTAEPDDFCYVFFTSGSTGAPKGIAGRFKAIAHYIQWEIETFQIEEGARVGQLTSPSFDAILRDLFVPLCAGGTICAPDTREIALSGGELVEWLEEQSITLLHCVPSVFRTIVNERLSAERLPSLRSVLMAGEPLRTSDVKRWMEIFENRIQLVNLYGPSETTMTKLYHPIQPDDANRSNIPIGKAMDGAEAFVLDEKGGPCPTGIVGEIYIRTPYRTLGYYNQPELTIQSFVPNPLCADPDDIVYKTGDFGRVLRDGNFEYLGRKDHQVKIRGVRVELEEIEKTICLHEAVRDAVVVDQENFQGDKQLCAYVVLEGELVTAGLREFLLARLPEAATPTAYVKMEKLPRTLTRKIDRRSLPKFDEARAAQRIEGPRTEDERKLTSIWSQLLGVQQIGVHENFFEIGGHSLLATQLATQISEAFQVELPLRSFFDAPTIAGIAALLPELVSRRNQSVRSLPVVKAAPEQRYEPFPMTDVQHAYWIGRTSALEMGNVSCQVYAELEFAALDLDRFTLAWGRLIERHEMLRAVALPDGRQKILERTPPFSIEIFDLEREDAEMVKTHLENLREKMSHQTLEAERWPLFEVKASRKADGVTRIHFSYDMLFGDAWSIQILLRDLSTLYNDPTAALPALELSFRDYALAEQAICESELYTRAREYWLRRLPLLPPSPELPTTYSPESIAHPVFKRRRGVLSKDLWSRFKACAAGAGVTPSVALAAAFAEVCGAWSKSPRFTLNLTLFNRLPVHPAVNEIVGDFTSLTLLAVDHTVEEHFSVRAARLQEQLWEDLDHRYFTGVEAMRELGRLRGGVGLLMPVVFTSTLGVEAVANREDSILSQGKMVYGVSQTPQVWLDVQVTEEAGELAFNWDAVEAIFPEGMLDDMFGAYDQLLHTLASRADCWVERSRSLLPAWQLEQRAAVHSTDAPISDQLLHMLFERQAFQHPTRTAIIAPGRSLTYGELFKRANQIGTQLRRFGARPNELAAIVMEKGWEQAVAALGICASGAAYLPIDPKLPPDRIRYLLENGEVRCVLTQSWLKEKIDWPEVVHTICITDEFEETDAPPLPPIQQPTDLAYVIYTSGSTGAPKGVMIDHRGAVNTVLDINQRFNVGPEDRVLALSSLSFDLSVYDLFGPLAAGGAIVFPKPYSSPDPEHWADLLTREHVTIWNSVPALMKILLESAPGRGKFLWPALRLVMLSGDWIPVTLPDQIREAAEKAELISLGGATEASIWSILYPIQRIDPAWPSIPYGKPMVNQRIFVLDGLLEERPIWTPGDLYISGVGLAKGYWRDEEKSRARFIKHPRTGDPLYRTGDLGRYLPSGDIEFLGRDDFQVKIQGHRIELGEIESILLQHPAVQAAVVADIGETNEAKRLTAYLTPVIDAEEGNETDDRKAQALKTELREYLSQKLPEYMIPSAIVIMDSLPLTSNGKVDRQSLPRPIGSRSDLHESYIAPRTPIEQSVAQICAQLLGVEQVGVYDDFFELGADSLLATRARSRFYDAFQVEIPLRRLFESPTVSAVAEAIQELQVEQIDEETSRLLEQIEQFTDEQAALALTGDARIGLTG
jgi:amino acid adenylation domain-containing protein